VELLEQTVSSLLSKQATYDSKHFEDVISENLLLKECLQERTNQANETIMRLAARNEELERASMEYLKFVKILGDEVVHLS
jgi:predicted RecB family endonuclease